MATPHRRHEREVGGVLPQLSVFLLGRNFDDPGLVDDPGGPVSLLNDADDPGLVALLLLDVLEEKGAY